MLGSADVSSIGGITPPQIGVGDSDPNHGGAALEDRYTLPAVIPPGQTRFIRVSWISKDCIIVGGQGFRGTDRI